MADELVKIEYEYWRELRDLHLPVRAPTYFGYCLVDNYIRWFELDPKSVDVVFYSLNGDWSDGLFLALWESEEDGVAIHVSNLGGSHNRFVRLLSLIDYSKGVQFNSILERANGALAEILKLQNIKSVYQKGTQYYLPRSEALNFRITKPEGVVLKVMSPSDVHIAHEVWPYKRPGTLELFQTMARLGVNIGAFDTNGQLMGWAFRWTIGSIAALQVDEKHMRRGLGALVTKANSRQIAEMGHDVCACVNDTNVPSQRLFEKLGFTNEGNCFWVNTLPTDLNSN